MKKLALMLTALAATAISTSASAVTYVNTGPVISGASSTFSTALAGKSGSFTDVIHFLAPVNYMLQSATISTVQTGSKATNVDFTSVLLNGVAFTLSPTGQVEFGSITNQPLWGMNTLTIIGKAGIGAKLADATFGGTLSFGNAVPEPATWALMLLGIGGIGAGMRRRKVSALRFA